LILMSSWYGGLPPAGTLDTNVHRQVLYLEMVDNILLK